MIARSLRSLGAARPVLALLAMAGIAQGFGRIGLAFILPGIREDIAGSYAGVGLVVTISYVGYTAGSYGVRRATRRWADLQILRTGLLSLIASFLVLAASRAFWMAGVGFAISGIASAMVWLSTTALVNVNSTPRWRNLSFGATMSSAGAFIAISGWAITHLPTTSASPPWRELLIFQSVIGAACLALSWTSRIRDDRAERTPGAPPARPRTPRPVRVLTAVFILFGATQVLFLNFFVAAVQSGTTVSSDTASLWFSLLGVASIVGGLASGRILDVIGARACLLGCLSLLALCSMTVVLRVEMLIPVAALVFGACIAAIGAASVSYLAGAVEAALFSASYALITAGLGAGQVVSPFIGGWLIDIRSSFDVTYLLAALAAVAGAVLVSTLPDTRKRLRKDI